MPIRHRYVNPVADAGNPDEVGPNEWNDFHVFRWRLVTAGETLVASDPIAATITTAQAFPIPAVVEVGDIFELRNNSNSTAIASLDPGAGRQVQGAPVADTVTLSPGEAIALFARTTTFFELLTPGAVGPAGPPGGTGIGGTATVTISHQTGRFEHIQTVAAVGVTPSSRLTVGIAPAPDSAENDPELLDVQSLWASPGTDQITIGITFAVPTSGPILINWSAF